MAETKTRAPRRASAKSNSKRTKPRKPATTKPRQRGSTKNGVAHEHSARKAVEDTAKQAGKTVGDAGHSVGRAAIKAKTPLLAGGAAVAGAAGGLALGARQARKPKTLKRPKVKINSHDLAKAARDIGQFGMDVGQLAAELRKNREQANSSDKRRSPIEVVLQGLTSRSHN